MIEGNRSEDEERNHHAEGRTSVWGSACPDKTEGPATVIRFLGFVIGTDRMECRLLEEKLGELKAALGNVLGCRKLVLRDLQSLLGKLAFACRVLPMRRFFCHRLAMATAGMRSLRHFVCLTLDLSEDLQMWSGFLNVYSGRSLFMEGPFSS